MRNKKVDKVPVDPRTGNLAAGRHAGRPAERLARRGRKVELSPDGTQVIVYRARRHDLVVDPGWDLHHHARPDGAIPVMSGWITPR